uniref:Ig-like domain-containing protein n=1 Tax=Sarcophilus harrisii TaxID=9305 RepID=A0A7N4P006_SARHA
MPFVSILALATLLIAGTTEAQSVTQPENQVSVSEGSPVELKCTYSSSGSVFLFWYVKYPNQELQILLRHISGESNKGFQAKLNKEETSYHLKKLHVQEEDSAVYFCALSDTMRRLTKGAEHKPAEMFSLKCSSKGFVLSFSESPKWGSVIPKEE